MHEPSQPVVSFSLLQSREEGKERRCPRAYILTGPGTLHFDCFPLYSPTTLLLEPAEPEEEPRISPLMCLILTPSADDHDKVSVPRNPYILAGEAECGTSSSPALRLWRVPQPLACFFLPGYEGCFILGGKLCSETEFVFSSILFNIGLLQEFYKPRVYRIISLDKPIKK